MQRNIRIQRLLPYPIELVWQTLTDASVLSSWLMESDFAPILGHKFTFRMKPQRGWDGVTHCEVMELDAPSSLAYSYRGKASGEKTLSCAGIDSKKARAVVKGIFTALDTVLRFRLSPEVACDGSEKTRLTLEHTGYRGLKLVVVSYVMGAGWKRILDRRLPLALEKMKKAPHQALQPTAQSRRG